MDVKEKIQLDKDLVKWLNRKRKLDSMKDEVAVLEVFDCIIPEIEKIYASKLEERDSYDKFSIDSVCGGVKSEDGIFHGHGHDGHLLLVIEELLQTAGLAVLG